MKKREIFPGTEERRLWDDGDRTEWGSDTKEPLLKARIQVWSGVPQSDQADDQNYPAMVGAWLGHGLVGVACCKSVKA